jgi:hypothetical protein
MTEQILYRIVVRHHSPKDSHTSTQGYTVQKNDEQVLEWMLAQDWFYADDEDDLAEEFDVYDEDYEIIGTETRREKWLRVGGQINSEHVDYSDLVYGLTLYGWEEIGGITEDEIETLGRLGLLIENEEEE